MNKIELPAVCWAALANVASKETRRDALVAGAEYDVELEISGRVQGRSFSCDVQARVAVGHDEEKISSEAAPQEHLVGYLLSLLPKGQRESVLRELPDQFAESEGVLPDVDRALVEASKNLLGRLRARVQKTSRGRVSVSYVVSNLVT